ncbi:MAG: matrixin family metalloprotease [Myxococcota bacterium]
MGNLLMSPSAEAYCRSRACDFDKAGTVPCKKDPSGCPTNGAELYWPTPSFDIWVDHRGSVKHSITGEQLKENLIQALATWTDASCGNSSPSIAVGNVQLMEDEARIALALTQPEQASSDDPAVTTSLVTFVDSGWMKESADAIALTTTSFGTKSGRIFGADIELDSDDFRYTLDDDPSPDYDLLAVLTHESGHLLGLADLVTPGPTMFGHYGGKGDVSPRDLSDDDEAGVCAIYPPGRFADEGGCGCRFENSASSHPSSWFALGALGLALFARRARSTASKSRSSSRAPAVGS